MIDMFALVLTLAVSGFVVLRAIKLDRELEWFPRPRQRPQGEADTKARAASAFRQAVANRQSQAGNRPRRR